MVNAALTISSGTDAIVQEIPVPANPEIRLAISYAPAKDQAALAALFALDDTLGNILRATREPLLRQMKLTWWRDALIALDRAPPPAEPVLQAIAAHVVPCGITGEALSSIVEGWELLADDEVLENEAISCFADGRGSALFRISGIVLNVPSKDPIAEAGQGWALVDLARNLGDREVATRAIELAREPLRIATRARWSRRARALGALAILAKMDAIVPRDQPVPIGSPRRVARLFRHRLTGR